MQQEDAGMKLYEEPHFTFRFADDRIILRFHLEGVEAGRRVSVFKIAPGTGERLGNAPQEILDREGEREDVAPPAIGERQGRQELSAGRARAERQ